MGGSKELRNFTPSLWTHHPVSTMPCTHFFSCLIGIRKGVGGSGVLIGPSPAAAPPATPPVAPPHTPRADARFSIQIKPRNGFEAPLREACVPLLEVFLRSDDLVPKSSYDQIEKAWNTPSRSLAHLRETCAPLLNVLLQGDGWCPSQPMGKLQGGEALSAKCEMCAPKLRNPAV